jgi:hypothetical protein
MKITILENHGGVVEATVEDDDLLCGELKVEATVEEPGSCLIEKIWFEVTDVIKPRIGTLDMGSTWCDKVEAAIITKLIEDYENKNEWGEDNG